MLGRRLTEGALTTTLIVPAGDGQRLAWLHSHGEVLDDLSYGEGNDMPQRQITVRLTLKDLGRFQQL